MNFIIIVVPGGGLVVKAVLDGFVVSERHRVRRTFGPAQY